MGKGTIIFGSCHYGNSDSMPDHSLATQCSLQGTGAQLLGCFCYEAPLLLHAQQ